LEKNTINEYKQVVKRCKEVFEKKAIDYGTAWRILRLSSITDQIFIKAQRIRSVQEKGKQKVGDDVASEFLGIINYCLIALIQITLKDDDRTEIPYDELSPLYDESAEQTRVPGQTQDNGDPEQIEDNEGKTLISEGIAANYQDIINYAVFCLIKLKFNEK